MSWRPTALNLSFLALAGWALFLGVLAGRVELVLAVVPLLVALVLGQRVAAPAAVRLDYALSADRLVEDERVSVTVTVRAEAPGVVELLEPLPPGVRLESGGTHAFFTTQEHS